MLVALPADQVDVGVVGVRPLELLADDGEREVRQVRAGEVVREVGRGERERVVEEPHDLSIGPASARSYTGGTIQRAVTQKPAAFPETARVAPQRAGSRERGAPLDAIAAC